MATANPHRLLHGLGVAGIHPAADAGSKGRAERGRLSGCGGLDRQLELFANICVQTRLQAPPPVMRATCMSRLLISGG